MTKEHQDLEFTGERFIPGIHGSIELEHLHRYLQACEITSEKIVLDIASGEGYGSAMLARKANKVIGVDISVSAIEHARNHYKKDNLEYLVGSCSKIPLPDASVDAVISFETIEHHDEHELMMQEIKRVLRPNGFLLISSPDKYHYSDIPKYNNEYHIKELYEKEFKGLLNKFFKNSTYFGQRIIYGSAIFAEHVFSPSITYWQDNDSINKTHGVVKPLYWIAIASDAELPIISSGMLEQPIDKSELAQSLITDREKQLVSYANAINERDKQVAELNSQITTFINSKSWKLTKPFRFIKRLIIQ